MIINLKTNNISLIKIIIKTLFLFFFVNLLFIHFSKLPYGRISLYNLIFSGRERLPFGENQQKSYNLTINNIDAMMSSHKISSASTISEEYQVVLIGDSSIWGFLHTPEYTLSSILEKKIEQNWGSKNIRVYNLGYPSLSILKDILFVDFVSQMKPDLIIWFVTLESFPLEIQTEIPLVRNNSRLVNQIIDKYSFDMPKYQINAWDYTIMGQRRNLADIIRLQLLGIPWSATGIDQDYPEQYNPAQRDFEKDYSFKDFDGMELEEKDLAMELITKTIIQNKDLDFIIINEPILISTGQNSHIRYNFYYPRWAYDQYREILKIKMQESGIKYYDFWDIVPDEEFTNSAIHMTETGQNILAERVIEVMEEHYDFR